MESPHPKPSAIKVRTREFKSTPSALALALALAASFAWMDFGKRVTNRPDTFGNPTPSAGLKHTYGECYISTSIR